MNFYEKWIQILKFKGVKRDNESQALFITSPWTQSNWVMLKIPDVSSLWSQCIPNTNQVDRKLENKVRVKISSHSSYIISTVLSPTEWVLVRELRFQHDPRSRDSSNWLLRAYLEAWTMLKNCARYNGSQILTLSVYRAQHCTHRY